MKNTPTDVNGNEVSVGSKIKILSLSGDWYDQLPDDEKADVESMINEVFVVEEIDECGKPWLSKSWGNENGTECNSHCIALENHEMLLVNE